jgi:hypothetical protein
MLKKRLDFGSEYKMPTGNAIVQRLFSYSVSREKQGLLFDVPESEGEHTVEFV